MNLTMGKTIYASHNSFLREWHGGNRTALVDFCRAGRGFNFAGPIDCNFSPVAGMAYRRMPHVQRLFAAGYWMEIPALTLQLPQKDRRIYLF